MNTYKCRHRKSWIVCGGYIEWCYECGALRKMKHIKDNQFAPNSYWANPTGGDENPFDKTWGRNYDKRKKK